MMVAREDGRTPGALERAILVIWACGVGGTWSEEPCNFSFSAVHSETPSRDSGSVFVAKETALAPCLFLSERHDDDSCCEETPPEFSRLSSSQNGGPFNRGVEWHPALHGALRPEEGLVVPSGGIVAAARGGSCARAGGVP